MDGRKREGRQEGRQGNRAMTEERDKRRKEGGREGYLRLKKMERKGIKRMT